MLAEIAEAGYDAVEIGFRRIEKIEAQVLVDTLNQHGLSLVASHTGGNIEETASGRDQNILEGILDYLHVTRTPILNYSGLRNENALQLHRDIETLSHAAEKCRQQGIHFCYHNHYWEMEEETLIMRALLNDASPSLGFCPDVGWIAKGGGDLWAVLEMLKERTHIVHLKDFASTTPIKEGSLDTVEFGKGVVPLSDTISWVKENLSTACVVAEQDYSNLPPNDAVRQNASFVRNHL